MINQRNEPERNELESIEPERNEQERNEPESIEPERNEPERNEPVSIKQKRDHIQVDMVPFLLIILGDKHHLWITGHLKLCINYTVEKETKCVIIVLEKDTFWKIMLKH